MSFQDYLAFGRIAENRIARYFCHLGYMVQPCYEVETEQAYKGPRVFTLEREYRAPDLFVMGKGKTLFAEAKCKSHFTWYRNKKCWNTGIDLHCYWDYFAIREQSDLPVWLMFFHMDS